MAIVGIGTGTVTPGYRTTDKGEKVISETPAIWYPSQDGDSVAVWPIDPYTMKVNGVTEIFKVWDVAQYMSRVLEMLQPSKKTNVPNFRYIIEAAERDGVDFCEYCTGDNLCCGNCIVKEWRNDGNNE